MPCLIGCLALAAPRLAILLVALSGDYIGRVFPSFLWPLAGFLFMPLTTLAYAYAINTRGAVTGPAFVLVVLAALIDLGALGGSETARRRRYSLR